jgi:hypothetical protein
MRVKGNRLLGFCFSLAMGLMHLSAANALDQQDIQQLEEFTFTESRVRFFKNENQLVGIASDKQVVSSKKLDANTIYIDLTKEQSWASWRRQVLLDGVEVLKGSLIEGARVVSGVTYLVLLTYVYRSLKKGCFRQNILTTGVYTFSSYDVDYMVSSFLFFEFVGAAVGARRKILRIREGTDHLGRKMADYQVGNKAALAIKKKIVFLVKEKDEAAACKALLEKGFLQVIVPARR